LLHLRNDSRRTEPLRSPPDNLRAHLGKACVAGPRKAYTSSVPASGLLLLREWQAHPLGGGMPRLASVPTMVVKPTRSGAVQPRLRQPLRLRIHYRSRGHQECVDRRKLVLTAPRVESRIRRTIDPLVEHHLSSAANCTRPRGEPAEKRTETMGVDSNARGGGAENREPSSEEGPLACRCSESSLQNRQPSRVAAALRKSEGKLTINGCSGGSPRR
jgi:hypothetical protein